MSLSIQSLVSVTKVRVEDTNVCQYPVSRPVARGYASSVHRESMEDIDRTPQQQTRQRLKVEEDDEILDDTDPYMSEASSNDSAVVYYNPEIRPTEFVCPFSQNAVNPCSMNTIRKKKTTITNHLIYIKIKGGDKEHPLNDPLWNTDLVKKYYLQKRPKLSEAQKKITHRRTNQRTYRSRLKKQEKDREALFSKFMNAEVTGDEFRKILVGKQRLEWDRSMELSQLQCDLMEKIDQAREEGNKDRLKRLEELSQRMNDSDRQLARRPQQVKVVVQSILSFFGKDDKDNIVTARQNLIQYAGFDFPSEESVETYYWWAAIQLPQYTWAENGRPENLWTPDNRGALRASVQNSIRKWTNSITGDDDASKQRKSEVEKCLTAFNASLDLIKKEYEKFSQNDIDLEIWCRTQHEIWQKVCMSVRKILSNCFTGGGSSILEVVETIDELRGLVEVLNADKMRQDVNAGRTAAAISGS